MAAELPKLLRWWLLWEDGQWRQGWGFVQVLTFRRRGCLMAWEIIASIGMQTALFLLGGYAMVLRNEWSTKDLKEDLESMEEELKKLAQVITQIAVQDIRIDNLTSLIVNLQHELSDLRRGDGWIERIRNDKG